MISKLPLVTFGIDTARNESRQVCPDGTHSIISRGHTSKLIDPLPGWPLGEKNLEMTRGESRK